MKIFPWDNNEKPYFINGKIEWYIDKITTKHCYSESNNPVLEAVCFFVTEIKDGKREFISRVLIDKETNEILAEETSLEQMACKIDFLRLALNEKS